MEKNSETQSHRLLSSFRFRGLPDLLSLGGPYLEDKGIQSDMTEALLEDEVEGFKWHSSGSMGRAAVQGFNGLAKLLFIISCTFVGYYLGTQQGRQTCILGNEGIFDDIPVIYENVRFQRAGFHDMRHDQITIYEGPPNRESDEAWDKLLEVGVVLISDKENSRIVNGSASTRRNMHKHIVELEMFHQLHCLKWLRDRFWEFNNAINTAKFVAPGIPQWSNHTDHCIDYLRQAIMCHGDLTPITFEWIPEVSGYIAHHSTEHECRKFDAIYEWARQRGASGFHADGKHTNVELQHSEMFD